MTARPMRQKRLGSIGILLSLTAVILLAAGSSGCLSQVGTGVSSPTTETTPGPAVTRIGSLIENPAAYDNTTVTVAGKITLECGSGCWFNLDDGSGIIYVSLGAGNFAIPQKVGARAVVTGTVRAGDAGPVLMGERVVIDGKAYP